MKTAGHISHIINSHLLIIDCDRAQLPPLYNDVLDASGISAGRLVEIFGNIQSPSGAVWCSETSCRRIGEELYISEENREKKCRKSRN